MKLSLLIYFLVFAITIKAQTLNESQQQEVDSLLLKYKVCNVDTEKIDLLISIATKYQRRDNNEALKYANTGLEICEYANNQSGKARILNLIADINIDIGDYEKATELFNAALKIGEEIDHNKIRIFAYDGLGTIAYYQEDYEKSMEYLHKSIEIGKKIGSENVVRNYALMGSIYGSQEDYKKALEYFQYAIDNEERESRHVELYYNMAYVYTLTEDINKSIEYYKKCMSLSEKYGPVDIYGFSMTSIGENYELLDEYSKALKYYKKSMEIFKEINDNKGILLSHINIGRCEIHFKEYSKAISNLTKALSIANDLNIVSYQSDVYELLCEAYEQTNDFEKALKSYQDYKVLSDSILMSKGKSELMELQTKYDVEKKENEISSLNQENQLQEAEIKAGRFRNALLVIAVVLVLLTSGSVFWFYQLRNKQKSIQLEQKLLRTQMNPHFIFNALASIQKFVLKNNPQIASDYLARFSVLMRSILESSRDEYVSMEKELETLENYFKLNQFLLDKNTFDYKIEIDPHIDIENTSIPPMLTQPFIENSIKHGQLEKNDNALISIRFKLISNSIYIEIEDNGVGYEKSRQQKTQNNLHKSLALQITNQRLENLTGWNSNKTKMQIFDLNALNKNGTGTKVTFSTPYRLEF